MSELSAWFISDLHVQRLDDERGVKLLSFLDFLITRKPTHLFLLGDIFDLWVGPDPLFIKKYQGFVDRVKKLKDLGVDIRYFEGNHDVHIEKFWQSQLHIPVFTGVEYQQVGPWILRLEHGDLINQEDQAYLRYRRFLRSAPIKFLLQNLPGTWIERLGQKASHTSRKFSQVQRAEQTTDLIAMCVDYGRKKFLENKYDFFISGHLHVPVDHPFTAEDGHKARIINLDSWFTASTAVGELRHDGFFWHGLRELMG